MKISVLLSSGEIDEWEEVSAEIDTALGGALVVTASDQTIVAVYAGGMWMRFVVDEP